MSSCSCPVASIASIGASLRQRGISFANLLLRPGVMDDLIGELCVSGWFLLARPHRTPALHHSLPGCLVSGTWDSETLSVAESAGAEQAETTSTCSNLQAGVDICTGNGEATIKRSSRNIRETGVGGRLRPVSGNSLLLTWDVTKHSRLR
jgi:hypothetical protein